MWVVAVTGGIGSGKSTVAELFGKHGVPVIDTDIVARNLVQPGEPLLKEIFEQFGDRFATINGALDRRALREHIFNNETKRLQLESLLHPAIREEVQKQLDNLNAAYCLILIPLLVNNLDQYPHDRVLFVDTEEHIRIERSATRDRQPAEKIRQVIASQPGQTEMLAIADDVLNNNGDLQQLSEAVNRQHQKYLELAKVNKS